MSSKKNQAKKLEVSHRPACIFCGWAWVTTFDDHGAKIFYGSPTEIDILRDRPMIYFKTATYRMPLQNWTFFFNQCFSSWICAGKILMKFECNESFYFVTNNEVIACIYLNLHVLPYSVATLVNQYIPRILLQMESTHYFISIDEFASSSSFVVHPKKDNMPSIYPQKIGYGCRCKI